MRKACLNQLMNQSYGEFALPRTAHKMRGVMRGVWSVLKDALEKEFSKNKSRKIIEKFFLCAVSNGIMRGV